MSRVGDWIDAILAEVVLAIPTMNTFNGQLANDRIRSGNFPLTMIYDAIEAPAVEIQWRVVRRETTLTMVMIDRTKTPDEMRDFLETFRFGLQANQSLDLSVQWVRAGPFTAKEDLLESQQDRYGIIEGTLIVEFWD